MVEYSEDYFGTATATADADGWQTASRGEFEVGIPPEFGGEFDGAAPENYYTMALTNCFLATFKVMADNSGVSFEEITARGTLRLRPEDGTTVVDSFDLDVRLEAEEAGRMAELLLERTMDHCFILDSVAFDVNVSTELANPG